MVSFCIKQELAFVVRNKVKKEKIKQGKKRLAYVGVVLLDLSNRKTLKKEHRRTELIEIKKKGKIKSSILKYNLYS